MCELFLFSFSELSSFFNSEIVFLMCFITVFVLTVLCVVISLRKNNYSINKRLWVLLCLLSISLIDFWIEHFILGEIKYLVLLVAIELISLALCLFVHKKEREISDEKRSLANFLSKCAVKENYNPIKENKDYEIRSEVIKAEPRAQKSVKDDIDFSHVKSVLKKLDYYPLKEQDKKSAKELENAIIEAEENGLDARLKQNINDGLGALLKLMSKYAI